MQIPRIIHQTWKTNDLPTHLDRLADTWKKLNPGWGHRLWTDKDNDRFVREQASDLLPAIESCSYMIQRLDIIRWLYLRRFGGVYADLDMECLVSLDAAFGEASFVTGEEPAAHARRFGHARLITNAFMAAVPDHPFVNDVLDAVQAREMSACVTHEDVLASTGPIFVTDVFDRKPPADVVVWPENRLSPDDANGELLRSLAASVGQDTPERQRCREQGTVAVHYWDNSWVGLLAGELVNPRPCEKAGFVFHPGWDSPGHDLRNAGRVIDSTAEACRRESRAVAFNTDGFLKTWIAPPFLWQRYRGKDPREGLYVRSDWSAAKSLRDWRSLLGHLCYRLRRWRR